MTTFDTGNRRAYYDTATHKVVPKDAVVLDLDDAREFVRLLEKFDRSTTMAYTEHDALSAIACRINQQTKPPRIPEPGLWGVVEASRRPLATRVEYVRTERGWERNGVVTAWHELIDPKPIRPGIEDGAS